MISLSQLPLIFHRRQNQSWETQTFGSISNSDEWHWQKFHQSQQISTDHPWRSSPRSLSGEHFREPLSLNCWGLAGPKSLCAHSSNSILRITFTQHLFLAESYFLPPEPLLHSSALAHALRLVLCCLVWFSEALIYPKILQPSVSVEEQGSVLRQIYLDHGILAQQ